MPFSNPPPALPASASAEHHTALQLRSEPLPLDFDVEKVAKCKRAIKRSIAVSGRTRKELEASNVATVQEYMRQRAELFEKKSLLLTERVDLEQKAEMPL